MFSQGSVVQNHTSPPFCLHVAYQESRRGQHKRKRRVPGQSDPCKTCPHTLNSFLFSRDSRSVMKRAETRTLDFLYLSPSSCFLSSCPTQDRTYNTLPIPPHRLMSIPPPPPSPRFVYLPFGICYRFRFRFYTQQKKTSIYYYVRARTNDGRVERRLQTAGPLLRCIVCSNQLRLSNLLPRLCSLRLRERESSVPPHSLNGSDLLYRLLEPKVEKA